MIYGQDDGHGSCSSGELSGSLIDLILEYPFILCEMICPTESVSGILKQLHSINMHQALENRPGARARFTCQNAIRTAYKSLISRNLCCDSVCAKNLITLCMINPLIWYNQSWPDMDFYAIMSCNSDFKRVSMTNLSRESAAVILVLPLLIRFPISLLNLGIHCPGHYSGCKSALSLKERYFYHCLSISPGSMRHRFQPLIRSGERVCVGVL
jgi:hypothetical protein